MQNLGKMITEQLRNPNELDISLRMEFGPFETVHKWKRMSECYEFVGARRSKHTAVAYKDAIYVFGGDNGKSMLNDLIRFDIREKSWTKTGCMGVPPAPRYHHSAVVHRSSMFVFGGYTGDILANSNLTNKNDLFEYKFPSAQWVQWKFTGQEPVPRSAHGAAVYDDKLWIFAGYDGNARLNDMWTINLLGENHQWERIEQKGQCPPTCCNFPVAVARGKMFVFSGQSGAKITNALFQFDFETHTWSRVCTEHLLRCAGGAPARRYGHVMLAHRAQLYVFGGAADNTLPNDLHCYDLDTQIWSVVQPPTDSQIPSGRLFHAGAVVGDALYIFGGTVDNNVRSGELFRFQLSNYPRCTLHDDFGRILKSHQFCDIQILVGPEKTPILAHQAILAARSQFLRAKIKEARDELTKRIASGEEEATEISYKSPPQLCITLPEATPEAFNMVLNYIYTDRIDPTEKDEDPASPATVLLVMSVLRLALRLNVPRLRGLCARFLRANLCLANVLQALHAAHHAQLHCIKEYCLRFVVKDYNFTPIVMSKEFEEMEQSLMVEVIRRRQQPPPKPNATTQNEYDEEIIGTTLEQDMSVLLTSSVWLADVRLRVGAALRPAHRSVLAARAAYFEAMFRSFSPHDNIVNIQICDTVPSEEAFDSLLRYVYYGDTNMPTEDSLYLFQAPIYYGFTNNRLQVFCKHNLQSNVSPENVLAILQAADRMRATDIKEYALKMIVHHFGIGYISQVARQDAIKNLAQPLLVDIIWALAEEPHFDSPLPVQPRSLPSSSSADTLTDDPEYARHRCGKS
ncbi:leucine-zipper-like transcriptional regulator 1 isoform X1 [Helicoverpa armigera]|uniref:leucine-zipper-like transcriptional regulator 1 isoform X1 n=1 Tax=Helicoverpa armigera TaxID=29058 RepID=UPI0021125B08|nr:leucine-zipper-like transcriptional regulator 1 isoform X1 [Helicoverpa armigera]XP_049699013.1 leucine-zipper-like transcriptional regulator 1 isoform X1 [Helicoverpa armigera]